jgi:hypothetical protein
MAIPYYRHARGDRLLGPPNLSWPSVGVATTVRGKKILCPGQVGKALPRAIWQFMAFLGQPRHRITLMWGLKPWLPNLSPETSSARAALFVNQCPEERDLQNDLMPQYTCHHMAKQTWRGLGVLLTPMSREDHSTQCDMASRANKRMVLKARDTRHVLRGHLR